MIETTDHNQVGGSTTTPGAGSSLVHPGLLLSLVGVAAAAAMVTLVPGVLAGPLAMQGSARGTAVTVLAAALALMFSLSWLPTGLVGFTVRVGVVAYLVYNAVLLLFGTPFNRAFLLYVAMLGLALFSLIKLVGASTQPVTQRIGVRRALAGYLLAIAAANAALWLARIVPDLLSERPGDFLAGTGLTTNPTFVQDLGFWLPAVLLIGLWWWSGRPAGIILGGATLSFWVFESISVALDQLWGSSMDPASTVVSAQVVPGFVGLASLTTILVFVHLRTVHVDRAERLHDDTPT